MIRAAVVAAGERFKQLLLGESVFYGKLIDARVVLLMQNRNCAPEACVRLIASECEIVERPVVDLANLRKDADKMV